METRRERAKQNGAPASLEATDGRATVERCRSPKNRQEREYSRCDCLFSDAFVEDIQHSF